MSIIHYIAHLMHLNGGRVITKLDDDKNVWVAFQCSTCGKIEGRHIAYLNKRG